MYLLAISSSDTKNFPSKLKIEKAVEDNSDANEDRRNILASIRAEAKQWFFFKPANIDLWTSAAFTILDNCFLLSFVDEDLLCHEFGDPSSDHYKERWAKYRELVLKDLGKHFESQIKSTDQLSSTMARLTWFLSDFAADLHHYLPIPSPHSIIMISTWLQESQLSLIEVSSTLQSILR